MIYFSELSDPDVPSAAAFSSLELRCTWGVQEFQPSIQNPSSITGLLR